MMNRSENLAKNTVILGIGTICTKVLTFIMVPLFSKWLSTEDYGDFDLLCTYITLLIPLITLSCGEALFRKLIDAKNDIKKSKAITSICTLIVVGSTCLLVLGVPIAFRFYRPELTIPFLALALSELLNNYLMYYTRGQRKLKYYTVASITFVISMSALVTIFVLLLNLGLKGILYGYAIGYVCSSLVILLSTGFLKNIDISLINKVDAKEIITYSAPLIPNSISWWIANVSDRTIINIVIGSAANGIYAIANKIPSICTALFSVFHLSWQETASDTINSADRAEYFNSVYNKILKGVTTICIVILSTNYFLFEYIFDAKYSTARYHVPILMTAIIFSFMAQFIGGIFIGFQNTKVNGFTTMIAAGSNIVIHLVLIKSIGLYAASISTLGSYLILFIIRVIVVQKHVPLTLHKKEKLCFIVYLAFVAFEYVANMWVHVALFLIACLFFMAANKDLLLGYTKKILVKLSHK